MTAADFVKALPRGQWHGSYGTACCPAHDDRHPSLSVSERDGRLLVKCHANCSQDQVIDALKTRGLWPGPDSDHERASRRREIRRPEKRAYLNVPDDTHRIERALGIWRDAVPAAGTLVESYLASRGMTRPIPTSLRFALVLKHTPSGVMLPAMVAAIQGPDEEISAVHRTYIDPRGDKKAKVSIPKMALGPVRGGAVRLGRATETLMLTEGIEDALALMQMIGTTAWALLGTAGFKSFTSPPETRTIILAPDADPAGDATVAQAAARFSGMGLRVMRLRPPDGSDWCDCLDIFEERAAIAEFDGHVDRADAELAVFAELVGGDLRHAA
jgi:hypothetical protein